MLQSVTTTLAECQAALLSLIDSDTILVVTDDLRALKIAHDRCIDTALCYIQCLDENTFLFGTAQSQLSIQTGDGIDGHDSTEDASTAMRLVYCLRFGWDDVAIHIIRSLCSEHPNISLESKSSALTYSSLKELIKGAGLAPNTVVVERE